MERQTAKPRIVTKTKSILVPAKDRAVGQGKKGVARVVTKRRDSGTDGGGGGMARRSGRLERK